MSPACSEHGEHLAVALCREGLAGLADNPRPGRSPKYTAETGRRILDDIVTLYPDKEIHAVLDNLNTHKKNEDWLKAHPNVFFHFTPTRASWLDQVEIWFSILAGKSLRGASFTSVDQLRKHIDDFIARYNVDASPFAWTKPHGHQKPFKNRRIDQL